MQIKEAADRLGITQRMLRHYEKAGLLEAGRTENGYRTYSEADLRRAARIRDLISMGFATREVRAMASCLSHENMGQCEGGIQDLRRKLEHIDRLRLELDARRAAVVERLTELGHTTSAAPPSLYDPAPTGPSEKTSTLSGTNTCKSASPRSNPSPLTQSIIPRQP